MFCLGEGLLKRGQSAELASCTSRMLPHRAFRMPAATTRTLVSRAVCIDYDSQHPLLAVISSLVPLVARGRFCPSKCSCSREAAASCTHVLSSVCSGSRFTLLTCSAHGEWPDKSAETFASTA